MILLVLWTSPQFEPKRTNFNPKFYFPKMCFIYFFSISNFQKLFISFILWRHPDVVNDAMTMTSYDETYFFFFSKFFIFMIKYHYFFNLIHFNGSEMHTLYLIFFKEFKFELKSYFTRIRSKGHLLRINLKISI